MLSFLPILIYILLIKLLDNFTVVVWRKLGLCVATGAIVAGLIFVAANVMSIPEEAIPMFEELGKGAFIIYLISRRKVVFFVEALCYGAAIGAGFAAVENLIYIAFSPELSEVAVALRGLGTALLHMGCTSLLAITALSFSKWVSPLPGICIHYLYNMFLLPVYMQLIVTIIVFFIVFTVIGIYDERRIYRWMDSSIVNDIKLLADIREGRLADTKTGEYLFSMKSHFAPEVFFDLICYIQLYLELVIKGKSRMLLKQEGLLAPPTPEEQKQHEAMKQELYTLEKNIGYMGMHILRPILRFDNEDIKLI